MLSLNEIKEWAKKGIYIDNSKAMKELEDRVVQLIESAYATGLLVGYINCQNGLPHYTQPDTDEFKAIIEKARQLQAQEK